MPPHPALRYGESICMTVMTHRVGHTHTPFRQWRTGVAEERGYVLRRVVRRAVRFGRQVCISRQFMHRSGLARVPIMKLIVFEAELPVMCTEALGWP